MEVPSLSVPIHLKTAAIRSLLTAMTTNVRIPKPKALAVAASVILVYKSRTVLAKYLRKFLEELLFAYRVKKVAFKDWLRTKIISLFSSNVLPDYRPFFRRCRVALQSTKVANHSHPESANVRAEANLAIDNFAAIAGLKLHSYEGSLHDLENISTQRDYHFAKDLQMPAKYDSAGNNLIKLIDVDYYTDMNAHLNGNPIVLYTFVPCHVGGSTNNATYCINENNQVVTSVRGGGKYQHELWHYDVDHLISDKWWGSVVYLVEQQQVDTDRRLIFLNPIRFVYGPFAWFLPGERLRRRQYLHGNIVHQRYVRTIDEGKNNARQEMWHSFGLPNDHVSCDVSDSTLTSAALRVANSKTPAISDVERILRNDQVENVVTSATILFTVLTTTDVAQFRIKDEITPTFRDVNMYQTLAPLITEDSKPTARQLHPPLIPGAVHPGRSHNNDQACVSGRINAVTNQVTSYPPFYWKCMHEFVQHLISDEEAHTLVPHAFDQQEATLKRPSQRGFLAAVKHLLFHDDSWLVRSFQKSEMYAKITAPRNISTLPHAHNFRLGQFTYPLANKMKSVHWYAFGNHPREISARMHTKFQNATHLVPTDVSKNDGSMGYFDNALISMIFHRAYAPQYTKELRSLLMKEQHARGVTQTGVKYEVDYNTLSGSSITSFRNSNANAVRNYIALRHTLNPQEAWACLGIYGGDDGIIADIDPKILTSVFCKTGMLIKAKSQPSNQPIDFLGRIFMDLTTSDHSIIDPMRHLRKLHMTVQPACVPDDVVLWLKAEAYLITDAQTPIIREWANMITRVVPQPSEATRERVSRYRNLDASYWSQYESPFAYDFSQDLARSIVCTSTELEPQDLDKLIDTLNNIKTYDELKSLSIVFDRDVVVEVPAVLGHDVVLPAKPVIEHSTAVKAQAKVSEPRLSNKHLNKAHSVKRTAEKLIGEPIRPKPLTTKLCNNIIKGIPCPYQNCKFSHDLTHAPAQRSRSRRNIDDSVKSNKQANGSQAGKVRSK